MDEKSALLRERGLFRFVRFDFFVRPAVEIDGSVDFLFDGERQRFADREHYVAVVVRAVYRHIPFDETVERGLARMMEFVARGVAADDGIFAVYRVEELFRGRGFAAVVTHFQHVAVELSAYAVDESRLVYLVAVARQHYPETVVFQHADGGYRVLFFRARKVAFRIVLRGGAVEREDIRRAVVCTVALPFSVRDDDGVAVLVRVDVERDRAVGFRQRGDEKVGVTGGGDGVFVREQRQPFLRDVRFRHLVVRRQHVGHKHVVHLIFFQHFVHKIDVVAVAVRQHQIVELSVRDVVVHIIENFAPYGRGIVVVGAVDEHIPAVGEEDEYAVALSNVHKVYLQFPVTAHQHGIVARVVVPVGEDCAQNVVEHVGCGEVKYDRRDDDYQHYRNDCYEKVSQPVSGSFRSCHTGII